MTIPALKTIENELLLSQQILENLSEGVYLVKAHDLTIVYTNPKFEEMFGYQHGEMIGQHVSIINAESEHDPIKVALSIERELKKLGSWRGDVQNRKKDGSMFWCKANISAFKHSKYGMVWLSIQQDITKIKHADELLKSKKVKLEQQVDEKTKALQHYINIIDKHVMTSTVDTQGIIKYVSDAFSRVSQYSKSELLGGHHSITQHLGASAEGYKNILKTICSGQNWQGEIKSRAKDGSEYWVEAHIESDKDKDGNVVSYTAISHDITNKKKVEMLSVTDSLTGLYNRLKLDDVLPRELKRAKRYGNHLSLIMFDIDLFKKVNDCYGHILGDAVLVSIATLTKNSLRDSDVATRWGGEEFLIICPDTDLEGAVKAANKLRKSIESFDFPEVDKITSSFGVASVKQGEDEDSFIKRVDKALYDAKKRGRNCVESSC